MCQTSGCPLSRTPRSANQLRRRRRGARVSGLPGLRLELPPVERQRRGVEQVEPVRRRARRRPAILVRSRERRGRSRCCRRRSHAPSAATTTAASGIGRPDAVADRDHGLPESVRKVAATRGDELIGSADRLDAHAGVQARVWSTTRVAPVSCTGCASTMSPLDRRQPEDELARARRCAGRRAR